MIPATRRAIVVVDNLYRDPLAVRDYALRQSYYAPYEDTDAVSGGIVRSSWWASRFKNSSQCPFKSSSALLSMLETAVGESIDRDHWRAPFPLDSKGKPAGTSREPRPTCLWNCCFHVKPDNGQQLGDGVHNHVTDTWNSVGSTGWTGIVYLNRDAPTSGGLYLWENANLASQFDWMTPKDNWRLLDAFANRFNRLILVRGDVPHSGSRGWGDALENGRMYQTFFFRTSTHAIFGPVELDDLDA